MTLQGQNILFFTRTMGHGGTENVVLQLCSILKPLVSKIIVCSCGGVNVDKLNDMGIKHYEIPDIQNKSPHTILNVIKTVKKIVNDEKITIIHSHHRMAVFYSKLVANSKNVKLIATAHTVFYDKKLLTKFSYNNINIIACGSMVKKNLTDFYKINSDNVTVIHNAIEKFDGEVVQDENLKNFKLSDKMIIANIGRLSKEKGIKYFIGAIPVVKEKYDSIKYVIVGDGEDREKLENLCKKNNISDDVLFMGYRTDVRNIMSQVDIVVLSSLWEGLPLTPIEAFSVSKPVIGTAVDGTVEIIEDMKNGLLVPKENSNAIANAIIKLVNDKDLLHDMSLNAKKRYDEKFSFDIYSEKIRKYYENL